MLLMLWLTLVASGQTQDDNDRARQFYENGAILYDEGRYEDAILAWQEAWELSKRPLLLFNIANAQERLGLWRDALETLNRYRVYAKVEERERLDRRIANLERRLAEETPSPVPVTPEETAPVSPEPVAVEPQVDSTLPVEQTPNRWLAPSALTLGAAGLVTGTVFALRADAARTDADALCQGVDGQLLCPSTAEDALRQDQFSSLAADSAFIIGGVGLLSGTVLLLIDAPVQLTPSGVTLRGQF
ncbi:MAG: hypothetical protein AAFV53_31550 [Myxococcota bacterium]